MSSLNSSKRGDLLGSNPVINHITAVDERAYENGCATYRGIANKTILLMLFTVLGYIAYSVLTQRVFAFDSDPSVILLGLAGILTIVCSFVASLSVSASPVAGPLYCVCEGYLLGFISVQLLADYAWLSVMAFIITALTVTVMAVMFARGIIRADMRFHMVLRSICFTLIAYAFVCLICSFVPFTAPFMALIFTNPLLGILSSLGGAVVAALFLISDFETIADTVEYGLPERYEWPAAFGLAFTVIWLYMRILSLLVRIYGKKKD